MPGWAETPLRVAIIGSGPSGFYAAEELLQAAPTLEVTMIERLPVPFGLVRSGVAPDHPKLKQPVLVYDRIARSERFHYFGNVQVDRDVRVADLLRTHHALVFASGCEADRRLRIRGEHLAGSHCATQFVGWYNGHPDYRDVSFDLSQPVAVIVGHGNVALDLARMLAKPVDLLRKTDIAEHALEALASSRVTDIHVVGRRGPAQASFTSQELNEIGNIPGCAISVDAHDLDLNEASRTEAADKMSRNIVKNLEILRRFASSVANDAARRIHFHFFKSPIEVLGAVRVQGVRLAKTVLEGPPFKQVARNTDECEEIACGLLMRSIGYRGARIEGLPFDDVRGVLPHEHGRLVDEQGRPLYGLYATGWIKRGPSGIIGTNRADSLETIQTLLADRERLPLTPKAGAPGLAAELAHRGCSYVSYRDWLQIDAVEVAHGEAKGKPREKLTSVALMLDACRGSQPAETLSAQTRSRTESPA